MEEKDFKRFMIPVAILVLAVLGFLIVRPIFMPIILGLLFAYVFYSFYKKLEKKIKSSTFAALIVIVIVTLLIVVPLLLLMPLFVKQVFEAYLSVKNLDLGSIIIKILPSSFDSSAIQAEIIASASHFGENISNLMLSLFQKTILNLPEILFGVVILLFTFYFSLKEGHNVKEYFSTLFPFPKDFEERFYRRFDEVTNSIVYGHIVIGLAQGVIAGIGYYMFGVPNALLLTVITAIVGVLPVIGPWLVWMPVDLFLFVSGDTSAGIQLLIYGFLVINMVELVLRPQVVARKADMNPAIALIGAIGGTYAFGVMGFFIGPLLLAYLILLIELYKNKDTGNSIIIREEKKEEKK